jgi:MoaA/NifB/PqqE/SkfB family radical SAM enzyme
MNKYYGLLHILWLDTKRRLFGKVFMAEADITDNCNLRCKHCYHFHGKQNFEKKELPIEIWKERFNDLYKKGIRFILLVGGEPALRKDILMLADRIFPFVYVITNGTIKIPDEFKHRLYVSMDGSRDINDSIRGGGVFSRIIKNYSGDSRVIINMTLTKDNYTELEDVIKISMENGFGGVVSNICASGSVTNISMRIERSERAAIIDELKRVKSKYPHDFLLSDAMIKWYEFPDHSDSCFWGDEVFHFDVSWKPRRCFADADCSNCGCLSGSIQSHFRMLRHPKEMIKIGFV